MRLGNFEGALTLWIELASALVGLPYQFTGKTGSASSSILFSCAGPTPLKTIPTPSSQNRVQIRQVGSDSLFWVLLARGIQTQRGRNTSRNRHLGSDKVSGDQATQTGAH